MSDINVIQKRDEDLDLLRAFSIFWVMIVHCLYWPNILDQGVGISILLIEMPIIFFITGASNIYAKKRSLMNFYKRRLLRVLKPYEVFAIINIILLYITHQDINFTNIIRWILPYGYQYTDIFFLPWHLWFMPVYILLVLILPILLFFYRKNISKYYIVLVQFALILFYFKPELLSNSKLEFYIPTVLFYSFWTAIGFEFKRIRELRRNNNMILPLVFTLLGIGIMYMIYRTNPEISFNMQDNKIPVKLMFSAYSLIAMSVFYILAPGIIFVLKKLKDFKYFNLIINSYNVNGFSIYLFHPFIFLLLFHFYRAELESMNKTISTIIIMVLITNLSPLLGWVLGKLGIR
ncbi:MAG: acyltransferase [Andreesenia angusta]|nr:acyltransferase [Andreesenia angusta]